jgi:hypothetical protein
MENAGRVIAFAIALNMMLLAYQVPTNLTSVLGWIFGGFLALAVLASFRKPSRYSEKHGDQL